MKGALALIIALVVGCAVSSDASSAGDAEVCQPIPEPPRSAQPKENDKAPVQEPPPRFAVKSGGIIGPALVFLGDSLTQGAGVADQGDTFPMKVIKSLSIPERQYSIYALGGKDSTLLSGLFLEQDIPLGSVLIIWIGRNNDFSRPETVVRDIRKIVNRYPSHNFLILSVLRGRYLSERPGELRYKNLLKLNQKLEVNFRRNFIDVGSNLSCDDRVDNIHLNSDGYGKIADAVTKELRKRFW